MSLNELCRLTIVVTKERGCRVDSFLLSKGILNDNISIKMCVGWQPGTVQRKQLR